jgi:hypothetical protein
LTWSLMKINDAKRKRKRLELNVMYNRKINHFLQKYANTKDSKCLSENLLIYLLLKTILLADCRHVSHEIISTLKISKAELYNLLKFVRHNINVSSLNLNKINMIDVLSNIYQKHYIHD